MYAPYSMWRYLEKLTNEEFLYEMANSKKKTIPLISGYWWNIASHFLKCVIFPQDTSRSHWIDEIPTWLNYINNQFAKTKSLNLKKEVYMEEVAV